MTKELIRAAGGIVHRDGNIFFTNIEQLSVYCKVVMANAEAARNRELFADMLSIRLYCNDLRVQKLVPLKELTSAINPEMCVAEHAKTMYKEIYAAGLKDENC